jgi:hypothetical protein
VRGHRRPASLAIGDAAFWIATPGSAGPRLHPRAIGGATSRILLVTDDPDAVFGQAVTAGAIPTAPPGKTSTAGGWPGSPTRSATTGKPAAPERLATTRNVISADLANLASHPAHAQIVQLGAITGDGVRTKSPSISADQARP